jgi:hypothetical protein
LAFGGAGLEALLAEEILDVVGPAGVEAAHLATQRLAERHQEQRQLLVDRVQTATEVAQRAAREYKHTDATYVAVRQALGAEWETALARVTAEEARLAEFDRQQPTVPTAAQREELGRLGEDVRQLWNHPGASGTLKQQLARVLIVEIVADIDEERDEVTLLIHWSGGHHTQLRQARVSRRTTPDSDHVKSIIETLRKVLDDASIAVALNRAQIRATDGQTWNCTRVRRFRQHARIAGFDAKLKEACGWLTQAEAATRLQISPMSVHRLVISGILPAERPHGGLPMVICTRDLHEENLQRAVSALRTGLARPLPDDPRQARLF